MTSPVAPAEFELTGASLRSLCQSAVVVPGRAALFQIRGKGALDCLQGLLTNDLVGPGVGSAVYGALLTPKGLIVADCWVIQEADGFLVQAEGSAGEAVSQVFRKTIPPRIATVTDRSGEWAVAWGLGEVASHTGLIGLPLPAEPGRVMRAGPADDGIRVVSGTPAAPFSMLLAGPANAVQDTVGRLVQNGATRGGEAELAAARVLAGWPTLGREIDDRTLPQEVRFDEIGGVSYTKGCYIGQETVARVHFRGHVNRLLRGVVAPAGPLSDLALRRGRGGREVGSIRTVVRLDDRLLGLAVLRREVEPGAELLAGDRSFRVVLLPFGEIR
jgi:folate-binding protein YgfZ